jgi:hypothetical protein
MRRADTAALFEGVEARGVTDAPALTATGCRSAAIREDRMVKMVSRLG